MSERDDARMGRVARAVSRVVGVLLILWALSDDPLIGGGPGFGLTQTGVALVGLLLIGSSFLSVAWNARALAMVFSIGFVVLIAEVGVRVLYAARYQRPFQADERAIYGLVPGSVREYRHAEINGGRQIFYRINDSGFRGDELLAKPDVRIVVYGDSFIQGEFSALENTFAERLEHHVSERLGADLAVEVVNAGVAGYGPDQALRKMQAELAGLAPDLVVLAVFAGNDFGDLVRNKLFRVDEDGVLIENQFSIGAEQRRLMEVRDRELLLKRVLRERLAPLLGRGSAEATPAGEVARMEKRERVEFFRKQHVLEYEEYVVRGDDVVHELAWDTYDADVSLTPESEAAQYKVRLMNAVLGQVKSLTTDLSIPLVLLPIPHPIDLGGHDTGEIDAVEYPDYTARGMVRLLEEMAVGHDMPVVDLFTPFRQLATDEIYFKGFDDHWNDHGQDLAGEWVADFLVQNRLLEQARSR